MRSSHSRRRDRLACQSSPFELDLAVSTCSEWRRFLYVTRALAVTEFKLRYFGSVLGYLWTLFRPLLLFGVLYLVFTRIIRFGDDVPHYPVLLLTGIVLWSFFADSTSSALGSLVARESLLRKLAFPRLTIPIATAATAAANLVLGLAVLLLLAVVDGISPSLTWLYLIPIALGVIAFAIGLSLLLSVLFVRFRDVQPIWEVALQLIFWGSPIIYMIDFVPESFREYVLWNPFAAAVQESATNSSARGAIRSRCDGQHGRGSDSRRHRRANHGHRDSCLHEPVAADR